MKSAGLAVSFGEAASFYTPAQSYALAERQQMKLERRFIESGELRVKKDDSGQKIFGYAAKFNVLSEDLGFFREELDPHAFDSCLAANPDVRALWNHDANHILGRTKAGTLRINADKTGLFYEIDPPATTMAKDLMLSMDRGDVTQSSFGFVCIEDTWREDGQGNYIRTVLKAELFDVSPVAFPAYLDATSGVRQVRALFPEGNDELKQKVEEMRAARSQAVTKEVDGAHLASHCFAYIGDATKSETWKLPIDFPGDEEKTVSHIKDALARFDQTDGIPADDKAKVYDKIVAAAKAHGIHVEKETYNSQVPAAVEQRDQQDDTTDTDDDEDDCVCDCTACESDDCANCTNGDCEDERCEGCGMRAQRTAAKEAEQRAAEVEAAAAETETLQLRLKLAQHRAKTF